MKNLSALGLIVWMAISTSCKKGEALNPIKLDNGSSVTKPLHDSTYYVYPDGYTAANAFLAPINLGVPAYLETKNDVITESFMNVINLTLPDRVPIEITHPEYLTDTAINTINVLTQTDIYVTFISTNQGYQKTLAYYTYPTNSPPKATSGGSDHGAMNKVTYIFPNANSTTSIGGLVTGNRIKLGNFNPGTSIGFVLMLSSWSGTDVNTNVTKFYSQDQLNPETAPNLKRHAIILYDNTIDAYLLGFEWDNREIGTDDDFNDLIILIKANKSNSIVKKGVAIIDKI